MLQNLPIDNWVYLSNGLIEYSCTITFLLFTFVKTKMQISLFMNYLAVGEDNQGGPYRMYFAFID